MINLGTLKEIDDLRSVWQHEALNFTPWVAENVDLLADAVGLDISSSFMLVPFSIFFNTLSLSTAVFPLPAPADTIILVPLS